MKVIFDAKKISSDRSSSKARCDATKILEKCGYKIETEEYDLNGRYQVTFNIETE